MPSKVKSAGAGRYPRSGNILKMWYVLFCVGVSRLYLDSYYLLAVVFKKQNKGDVERILYTARSPSFKILIPQIVLG